MLQPQDFGPYVLVEQLAIGGMAEIYLAKTRGVAGFEKYLALKLIHPNYADDESFVNMLIEEAKIAVRLNHVNIAQVFDLGRHDGRYFISMEYVDGADLFQLMRRLSERDIDVPIDVATYVVQEICTGLDYAHRVCDSDGKPLEIIHRDVSPQNILLSSSGEVKLVDFGIAKATSRSLKTQAGVIKGKYFYMSPEQAWGDPIDQRTDVFSAGIILYEVLTGQMLYLEEDMQRLLDMVRKADIAPPTSRRPQIPARAGSDRDEGAGEAPRRPLQERRRVSNGADELPLLLRAGLHARTSVAAGGGRAERRGAGRRGGDPGRPDADRSRIRCASCHAIRDVWKSTS